MASPKKTQKVTPQRKGKVITGNKSAAGRKAKPANSRSATAAELQKWRKDMEKWIDTRKNLPPADKTELKENVARVADEVSKGKQTDSSRLERLLNVILSIAPDVFDVAIATLANPLAGLGLVAKKIGERAKLEWQTAS